MVCTISPYEAYAVTVMRLLAILRIILYILVLCKGSIAD